jgi:hypothetical protein
MIQQFLGIIKKISDDRRYSLEVRVQNYLRLYDKKYNMIDVSSIQNTLFPIF